MRICFLTGASGTLGSAIVNELSDENHMIIGIGKSKGIVRNFIHCDFNNIDFNRLQQDINNIINNVDNIESIDLIHTAGVYKKEGKNSTENNDILNSTFNVNAFSFYYIVNILRTVWERLKVGGSVIALSSNLTMRVNKWTTSYISSKVALEGMVRSFAETLGGLGVRFNTISPGMFPSTLNNFIVPDEFKANSPLKRICEVQDICGTIQFLLSDNARSITAQNIVLDGGNSNGY